MAALVSLSKMVWQQSRSQQRCFSVSFALTVPHMASLAGWRPPVDFYNGGPSVAGHPVQDRDELCKGEVGYLPSPQALHPIEIKVLDTDDGMLPNKLVRQFEEPIPATVTDTLVHALHITNRPLAVVAAFLTAGHCTVSSSKVFERCFVPLRRIYHRAVIQVEEMLQTEIRPGSFTCSWIDVVALLLSNGKSFRFTHPRRVQRFGDLRK